MIIKRFSGDDGRARYLVRCDECSSEFNRQKRLYDKSKTPNTCRKCSALNKTKQQVFSCQYCRKKTSNGYYRCKSCAICIERSKHKTSTGAPYTPLSYCCDCNTVLKKYVSKRCPGCHNKNQNKGKSSERTKFNASKSWARIRNIVFDRDNYTCDSCKRRGSIEINAHHKLSFTHFKDHRLDPDNLITLCIDCHKQVHFGDDIDKKLKYIEDYFYL